MTDPHFVLVLSSRVFNQQGVATICSISQGSAAAAGSYRTVVTLTGAGTDTLGAVHCHQVKSLDWRAQNVRLKEAVPQYILDESLARKETILSE